MKFVPLMVVIACATAKPVNEPAPALALVATPAFAIDTHLHLTMASAAHPFFTGWPGRGPPVASASVLRNQIDPALLREAGVGLVFAALWPPPAVRPGRTALDETLRELEALDSLVAEQPLFMTVTSAAQVPSVVANGHIAVVPHIEGGEGITSLDDLDALYAAGARGLTLVHFIDSQLAGAAAGQLGAVFLGIAPTGSNEHGLTPLGREVVTRLMDLGMLIDLAHSSDATASAVLDLTEARGVPVLVTHTASREYAPAERNISDELVRRVAAGGGMISVTLNSPQSYVPPSAVGPQHQPHTCDDIVAHWKHFASLIPEGQVALGSDMNGLVVLPSPGGSCPNGLRNSGDLPELWAALVAAGISPSSLDAMGPRLLELWAKVESKANSAAQRRALRKHSATQHSMFTE